MQFLVGVGQELLPSVIDDFGAIQHKEVPLR
jgi:hypothetical protein